MNPLARLAIVPLAFIQFEDPATGQPMFLQKQNDSGETVDDLEKPVGVRAYTKGSQMYRNASADNTTEAIKAAKNGGKGVTGHTVYARDTEVLAKTVVEYVNFDYNGDACSPEVNRKFFADPEYVEVREQILDDQADTGKCLKASAKG